MIDISPFPTLIKLAEFLDGIQHFVTFVGKCVLTSILRLIYLLIVMILTTVVLIMIKQKEEIVKN